MASDHPYGEPAPEDQRAIRLTLGKEIPVEWLKCKLTLVRDIRDEFVVIYRPWDPETEPKRPKPLRIVHKRS